jgi:hypothetical protein
MDKLILVKLSREKPSTPTRSEKFPPSTLGVAQPSFDRNLQAPTHPKASITISATQLGSEFAPNLDRPKRAATQVTKVSSTGLMLDYPESPGVFYGRITFQCPYCFHMLPGKYAEAGWKYVLNRHSRSPVY